MVAVPYATFEELQSWPGQASLEVERREQAEFVLHLVSEEILGEMPRLESLDALPAGVKLICLAVTARIMANPEGVISETIGGSYTVNYGAGPLLSDAERKRLGASGTKAGTLPVLSGRGRALDAESWPWG